MKTNLLFFFSCFSRIFCFVNLTLSCLGTWLPHHISKDTLIFTIPHTSPLHYDFTQGHMTLIPSILSFLLLFQSSILHQVTKALGCRGTWPTRWYLFGFESALTWGPFDPVCKGGTHKVTHLLNHSAQKRTFKPEKHINHTVLQGIP